MELTQEQIEAVARAVAENIGTPKQSEDEPDWIKEIRRISAEEGGKTKKDVEEIVNQRIAEYLVPLIKRDAITVYLDGLEPEYHDTARAMLKDEYEKNPKGLYDASQHPLTKTMVQNSARWQAGQAKAAAEAASKAAGTPGQEEVVTGDPARLDKQGESLQRLLAAAGVKKTGDEVAQIVEAAF